MPYFNWTDDLSVNIQSIDDQHKKLINMINDFYDSFKSGQSSEKLVELVEGLKEYTLYHFSAEEELLAKHGYPGYDAHEEQHISFVEKVDDVQRRIKSGKMVVSVEVTNFLKDWLANHIKKTDREYSSFLVEKGVQ
jgi:methyl-accepting chemotaxis protein/hemerythrin